MSILFFLQEIRKVGDELGIEPYIVQGEELKVRGFGGEKNIMVYINSV